MNNWIGMSKQLPPERGRYLVYCPYIDLIDVFYWNGNEWERKSPHVTHWMNRPNPPENYVSEYVTLGYGLTLDE